MWFIPPSAPAMDKKSVNDMQEKIMSSISQIRTVRAYSSVLVLTSTPSFHAKAVIWSQPLLSLAAVGGGVPSCKMLTCREKAGEHFLAVSQQSIMTKDVTNCFQKGLVLLRMWVLSPGQGLCCHRGAFICSKLIAGRWSARINSRKSFLSKKKRAGCCDGCRNQPRTRLKRSTAVEWIQELELLQVTTINI